MGISSSQIVEDENGCALRRYTETGSPVRIPNVVGEKPLCTLLAGCFKDSCVELVSVGVNVSVIEGECFLNCVMLREIRFEDSSRVKEIGPWAFGGCSSLCSFVWPCGVSSVPERCFCRCSSLREFRFEDSSCVKEIGQCAFAGCSSLCSFVWPCGVSSVPHSCFYKSDSLHEIRFEDSSCVKEVGQSAFAVCSSLCSFVWPSGVSSVPERCFYWCSSLMVFEFERDSIVSTIGESAFDGCNSLKSMTIPGTVARIGANCFNNCPSLTGLIFGERGVFEPDCLKSAGLSPDVCVSYLDHSRPLMDCVVDEHEVDGICTLGFGEHPSVRSHGRLFRRNDGKLLSRYQSIP